MNTYDKSNSADHRTPLTVDFPAVALETNAAQTDTAKNATELYDDRGNIGDIGGIGGMGG